jgi:hypothetical protein
LLLALLGAKDSPDGRVAAVPEFVPEDEATAGVSANTDPNTMTADAPKAVRILALRMVSPCKAARGDDAEIGGC